MSTCKTCANTRTVDHGLDVGLCRDCQPDLAMIRAVIAETDPESLTAEEKMYRDEFVTLADRWEELVKALEPADWQTPLQRVHELRDNLVITGQMKELLSRS